MNNSIYKKGLAVVLIIALIIMISIGIKLASKEEDIIFSNLHESNDFIESNVSSVELVDEKSIVNKDERIVVIVDIDGAVKNPGVYEFVYGDRVNDAIIKAGGLLDKAYTKNINKARILVDGEKIFIQNEGEETLNLETNDGSIYNGSESQNNGKIDINTASKDLLMSLDGIGEVYAQKIIEYRNKIKFTSIEDIKKIQGIGEKTFEKIKNSISVKWWYNAEIKYRFSECNLRILVICLALKRL